MVRHRVTETLGDSAILRQIRGERHHNGVTFGRPVTLDSDKIRGFSLLLRGRRQLVFGKDPCGTVSPHPPGREVLHRFPRAGGSDRRGRRRARRHARHRDPRLGGRAEDPRHRARVRWHRPHDHPAPEPHLRHPHRPRGHPPAGTLARRRDRRHRRGGHGDSAVPRDAGALRRAGTGDGHLPSRRTRSAWPSMPSNARSASTSARSK